MSTLPKISIIVPVYKVAQYLRRCLDSIAVQTFTDWECILIDDGSPDKSGAICDEYAERDARFRVIHQENKGVSAARNAGLDAAQGEWIGFVDSDDWIEPNMYEHLYNDAVKTKADCVVCGFFGQSKRRVRKMCRTEKAVKLLFVRKGFGGFSFLRLIAAEKVHNIRYDTTISYMEDVKFFYEAFKNCKSVYWDNEPLYHYEQNTTSVTHQFGLTRHAKSALKLLDDLQMSEPKKDISTAIFVDKLCFCTALAKMYIKAQETKNASFIFLQQQLYKHFFFIVFSPQISLFMKCWVIIIAFPFLSKLPFLSRYISDTDIVYNGGGV